MSLVSLALFICPLAAASNLSQPSEPPNLFRTLNTIAQQRNVNVLYESSAITPLIHGPVDNTLPVPELIASLLAGTPFTALQVDERTFIIRRRATEKKEAITEKSYIDEVIVTGTRLPDRTIHTALSPVDVINEPVNVNSVDLADSLAIQLPGYTAFRLPLSDGQIFNRRSGLRGLNSDHVLILVNGKRRHHSAFIETADGQPTDLSHIPMYAIKRIEVLRDGASVMYGSDAIAGVINVILDDSPETSLSVQSGQYFEGDGLSKLVQFKSGYRTTESRATLTLAAFSDDPTSRSVQPADAVAFRREHPDITLPDPVQRWGQPEREGIQAVINARGTLTPLSEWFSFVTLSQTEGTSDFNWRNPDTNAIYTPTAAFSDFDLRTVYPAGFTPHFGQHETDIAATLGTTMSLEAGAELEASLTAGQNTIDYFISNTINASLGPLSPTDFKPGALTQREWVLDIDYQHPLSENSLWQSASLATGLVLKGEQYRVQAGDPASWEAGPATIYGLPAGSSGFPGYSPEQAGTFHQQGFAAYSDLNVSLAQDFDVDLALRYEDTANYAGIIRGKVSARYAWQNGWMARATLTNGFRTPSAGQLFSERTSQGLNTEYNSVNTSGRFSPLSPVAAILSLRSDVTIAPLRPERSETISAGIGYRISDNFGLNVDFYRIELTDRFGTTPAFELTAREQSAVAAIHSGLNHPIDTATFFQNLFDTTTTGFDIVLTRQTILADGQLNITAAANYNKTDVTRLGDATNIAQKILQEKGTPEWQGRVSFNWQKGDWQHQFTLRYTGSWTDQRETGEEVFQRFSPMTMIDVSSTWFISSAWSLRLSIENLFNTYPDRAALQANRGLMYSRNAPYDTDGGSYYLRTEYHF
ncbi:TonB-dependent receptor [Alteromonas sp. NFXS44]|uniref:TonB-dependent receptor plug domain-containing protein n=1 Tax=Alteromonas sp. NFXS44 TaxID=2818435 RepID=UPI0032DF92E1